MDGLGGGGGGYSCKARKSRSKFGEENYIDMIMEEMVNTDS